MVFSIGGIVFLLFIALLIILNRDSVEKEFQGLFLFSIVSNLLLDVGYVAKIGSFEVLFNYVASVFCFFFAFLVLLKNKGNKVLYIWGLFFFAVVLIGAGTTILSSRHFQTVGFQDSWDLYFANNQMPGFLGFNSSQFIVMAGRIFLFFFNLAAFQCCCSRKWILKSSKVFFMVGWIVLALCFVEFFLDNSLSPSIIRNIIYSLFGKSEATYDTPRKTLGLYMPLLTSREPSKIASVYFLLALNSLFTFKRNYYKKASVFLFVFFSAMLGLTSAMSSILYLIALIGSLVLMSENRIKTGIILLFMAIPCALVAFKQFGSRIDVLFNNFASFPNGIGSLPVNSETVRFYSIYNNLLLFLKNPLFGIGLGIGYSYSGLVTALCNIGILGVICWTGVVISSQSNLCFKKSTLFWALLLFFLIFTPVSHMGEMMYQDRSFFLLLLLCSVNRNEQFGFTFEEKKESIIGLCVSCLETA